MKRNVTAIWPFICTKKNVSAVAVHCALVVGVAAYAIGGAVVMRMLEKSDDETPNDRAQRAVNDNHYETTTVNAKSKIMDVQTLSASTLDTFTGAQLATAEPGLHECVVRALEAMFNATKCVDEDVDRYVIADIDQCYQRATFSVLSENGVEDLEEQPEWSFADSLIFTFTVITTIGYGNVAPVTFEGRVFLLIYGLIGVPLTLLTIADLGLFFSKLQMLSILTGLAVVYARKARAFVMVQFKGPKVGNKTNNVARLSKTTTTSDYNGNIRDDGSEQQEMEDEDKREVLESIALAVAFFAYLFFGAYLISCYEPELDFFKAFYFNFVTLTTVGLGDFVPRRESYLFITMLYTTFGLALTTLTVQIAAEYLKKLHYFGRKIENVANVTIWFGGQKMSVKSLIKHLGDQLDIPLDQMNDLNLDHFVDSAIKVEAGELKTLRKPEAAKVVMRREHHPISYRDLRKSCESENIKYVDERTSIATAGSDVPLAEETARTARSTLPGLDEGFTVSEPEHVPRRPYIKERIMRNSRMENHNGERMRSKRNSHNFQS